MTIIVEVMGLSRSYGARRGVENISFSLGEGEITGLLGPNGSGKTPLIKLIMGLLQPDSGEISIQGLRPMEAHALISYLPENTYLAANLTMEKAFRVIEDFYSDFDKSKALSMLEDFGLEVKQPLKTMSKGMQEKAHLSLVMSRNVRSTCWTNQWEGLPRPPDRQFWRAFCKTTIRAALCSSAPI